ncbi:MAG: hypothetical protein RBR09_11575 [Desulfobulbaceae bacterium]|jgi:hypothetical protein|nr:hypothetical protein [Desulfobulbaceae bacterium]MDY0351885.1 hypothetical protein [Desulfobulbaceae bacterium]
MQLPDDIGSRIIKDIIEVYPGIAAILERNGIGCVHCTVGTCLLKDVVAVHFLDSDAEARIEREINEYIERLDHPCPAE